MGTDEVRKDLRAAVAARQELGPEYEDAIIESFLEKLDARDAERRGQDVDVRPQQRRDERWWSGGRLHGDDPPLLDTQEIDRTPGCQPPLKRQPEELDRIVPLSGEAHGDPVPIDQHLIDAQA